MRAVLDAEKVRFHQKPDAVGRRMAQLQRQTAERLRAFDG
jgi:hypothetical protein